MPTFLDKLCPRADLACRVGAMPHPIVFTNGVFDILHRGHVSYLAQARDLGACLVIGLNSDASARTLGKGPGRPLNNEADRACVLAALESVSLVTLFDEPTPVELLKLVRPQVYVKGGGLRHRGAGRDALGAVLGRAGARPAVPRRVLHHGAGRAHQALTRFGGRLTSTMPGRHGHQRHHQPKRHGLAEQQRAHQQAEHRREQR
jgi:rfaE bifunctional protein nucleotidyltransferase chain/domain